MAKSVFSGISQFSTGKYTGSLTIRPNERENDGKKDLINIIIHDMRHPGWICRIRIGRNRLFDCLLGEPEVRCLVSWSKDFLKEREFHEHLTAAEQHDIELAALEQFRADDPGTSDSRCVPEGVLVSVPVDENDPRVPVHKLIPHRFGAYKLGLKDGPAPGNTEPSGQPPAQDQCDRGDSQVGDDGGVDDSHPPEHSSV